MAGVLAVAALVFANGAVAAQAAPTRCQVLNQDSHARYGDISTAVAEAGDGQTLRIRGTCPGHEILVDKTLTLRGIPPNEHARHTATIDAGGELNVGSVLVVPETGDLTLSGALTITGGERTDAEGGGVRVLGGSVTLTDDVAVRNNSANEGGGILVAGGTLIMRDRSTVTGNRDTGLAGGGIVNWNGTVVLADSASVAENVGSVAAGIISGGTEATLTMKDHATVTGNASPWPGCTGSAGAIYNGSGGTATLEGHASVTANRTCGVVNFGSTLILKDDATVSGNTGSAGDGGGIVNMFNSTVLMSGNARVTANTAALNGGGIFNGADSTVSMSGNAAISENTAGGSGGGIYNESGGTLVGVVPGTNVAGNTPDDVFSAG